MLHGTNLDLKQVRKLWKGLKRHPALASLDLGDCGLTDDSIHYVAKLLHKPKMEGGSHVSDSMASHDLKELNISANAGITLKGWTRFSIGLANNMTLQQLYLDYNDLLPEGAAVLAVAISVHPEIKFVDLEGCGIGDEGASHMLAALRKPGPPKLEKLVLTNNDISVEKVKSITALLPTPS
jgi:Ran GTPase-activating protein (RanGAP) involved in mRNA processing and transport